VKVNCLIDKAECGIHWTATYYISHKDSHSALEELSSFHESLVKSMVHLFTSE